ncbi:MAG: right-handed parallel beta-helix repeat-containing protein, partial [Acidobacteria bacterium]|nr:right-handed parallel beta-helix repeat-containing protein [Acidobacteriota bacterium]
MRVRVSFVTNGFRRGTLPETWGRWAWCASLLCVLGLATPAQAQYTKKITLTVGAGVVSGPHANFPVLVDVTNADLQNPAGSVQSPQGYDIVFRGEDTTTCGGPSKCMLAHEIELYDGAAGRVIAWVRVPSLVASTSVIHMYYGNAAITSPTESPGAVFDADYVGVWHLGETGNGSQYEYRDSSVYGNHGWGGQGDANAVPKTVAPGSAKIGRAQRFDNLVDGVYDFIDVGQDGTLNITGNQITMQAWVWHNITIDAPHGVGAVPSVPYGILNHKGYDNGGYSLWLNGNSFDCPGSDPIPEPCVVSNIHGPNYSLRTGTTPPAGVTAGAWHQVVATYDGANMNIIVDGALSPDSMAKTGNISPSIAEQHVWIGHGDQQQNRGWSGEFEGDIDEVRISRVARSLAWIQTEYNNQSNPGPFYSSIVGPAVVSTSLNTATVNYRSIGDTTAYSTGSGTCTATLGSDVISCPSATWVSDNRGQGDRMTIDGTDYTVSAVDSQTSLHLTAPFTGTPGVGNKSYAMRRQFASPGAWEDCVSFGLPSANVAVGDPGGLGTGPYTVPAGTDRLLIFLSGYEGPADPGISVTFGGQPMTEAVTASVGSGPYGRVSMFYLLDADIPSGSHSFVVSNGSPGAQAHSYGLVVNADQTSPIVDSQWGSVTGAATVTTPPFDVVQGGIAGGWVMANNAGDYLDGAWGGWNESDDRAIGSATFAGASSTVPYGAPGTDTATATFNGVPPWQVMVALSIRPTAGCQGVYSSSLVDDNRSEVGILYADGSPYTTAGPSIINFAGATTDPAHTVTLTVAPGNRHLGVPDTLNTGVVLDNTGNAGPVVQVQMDHVTLEWLEVTGGTGSGIELGSAGDASIGPANLQTIRYNLIHDVGGNGISVTDKDTIVDIENNFIFNTLHGIYLDKEMASGARVNVYNDTIYNSTDQGIFSQVFPKQPRVTLRNNIVHTSRAGAFPDMYISRPFDEAYFCTGVGAGPGFDPSGCGANIAAALANETTNQPLPFTGVNTACLYLGSSQPFRGVGVSVVGAPSGSGANLQWDYWNGSWSSLETAAFLDYNFEWDGFAYWADDPAGWSTRSVAVGGSLYYARVCRSGADSSPTEKIIARADVSLASRYNLTRDRSGYLHSLWRGAGVTGLQEPGVATAVLFNSATDLHIQTGSTAENAVLDQLRQDGGWQSSALTERFFLDIDDQVRPLAAAGSCQASNPSCWDVGADEYGATTVVELLSFHAVGSDSAVDLSWRTGSELRNLGFHLHRALSEDGPWTRVTSSLIPGLGSSPEGASYSYRDAGLTNGVRYFYRLEDIDSESGSTFHGPVSAVPGASPPAEDEDSGGSEGSDEGEGSDPSSGDSPGDVTPQTYGRPEDVSFRVVSRTKRAVVVELRTPGFFATPSPEGLHVTVPGFDQPTDPRAPDLPLKRVVLDALVGRHGRIVWVKERQTRSYPGLTPAAVGAAEIVSSPDGTVRPGRRAAALKGEGLLPPVAAWIPGDAFIGELKKLALEMNPIRYDTSSDTLLLAQTLRVKIAFDRRAVRSESGRGSHGRRRPRSVEET